MFRRGPSIPSLWRFLSYLIDMSRPGEPFIKGRPKITVGIDPLHWLPEELNRSRFRVSPNGFNEENLGALRNIPSATALGH